MRRRAIQTGGRCVVTALFTLLVVACSDGDSPDALRQETTDTVAAASHLGGPTGPLDAGDP